jgi:hypothetical protein
MAGGYREARFALVLHEGWSILTLADDRVLAGLLRLEHVGVLQQWALDVPANGMHHGYTAILCPGSIIAVEPCSEADAICIGIGSAAPLPPPHIEPHVPDERRTA